MDLDQKLRRMEKDLQQYANGTLPLKRSGEIDYVSDVIHHCDKVTQTAIHLGSMLSLSTQQLKEIWECGMYHDIGKAAIPQKILFKAEPLTARDRSIIQLHSTYGGMYLRGRNYPDYVIDAALHHHERYDGEGYPAHISGHDIPLYTRIITVADCYDAMSSPRVYKLSMNDSEIVEEMLKNSGTQFDPEIAKCMVYYLTHR